MTQNNAIRDDARKYRYMYTEKWWNAGAESLESVKIYTPAEQKSREKRLTYVVDSLAEAFEGFPENEREKYAEWGLRVRKLIHMAGEALDINDSHITFLREHGFCTCTRDFIKKAGEFDSGISLHEKLQALRNVWIMNSIQILTGKKVECTPSVLAYSLLYPYTDNLLDSMEDKPDEKRKMYDALGRKLRGLDVKPVSRLDETLFSLVDIILEQYPYKNYNEIYENLQNIYECQQGSLLQQIPGLSPYETDILGLSFAKGGASVLADAYLIDPFITDSQAAAMFSFGIFLQLLDDIQDVDDDKSAGHMTVFSQTAGKWRLDSLATRLLSFMNDISCFDNDFNSPEAHYMTDLIKRSCHIMLQSAVAQNKRYFSYEYLKDIERKSPVRFLSFKYAFRKIDKVYNKLKESCKDRPLDMLIAEALAMGDFKPEKTGAEHTCASKRFVNPLEIQEQTQL